MAGIRRRAACAAGAVAILIATPALADRGDVDRTFSGDGRTTYDYVGVSDRAHDVLIQKDGRILVAGYFSYEGGYGTYERAAVGRYLSNGRLDQGFGSYGWGRPIGEEAHAIALDPQGRIVVAANHSGGVQISRLTSVGTKDSTFCSDWMDPSTGADTVDDMVLMGDGRILGAGCRDAYGEADFFVFRLTARGSPDPKFGVQGKARIDVAGGDDCATGIAVQDDGSIVVAGNATVSGKTRFAAVRLKPGGALDTTFGNNGMAVVDFRPPEEGASALALQEDGKAVIAGYARGPDFNERHFALVRLRTDGTPDPSFSGDGLFMSPFGDGAANDLEILANGRILATGWVRLQDEHRFVVEGYLPKGAQDRSFGHRGRAVVDLSPQGTADAEALAIDVRGGRLFTAGWASTRRGDIAVVAYEA